MASDEQIEIEAKESHELHDAIMRLVNEAQHDDARLSALMLALVGTAKATKVDPLALLCAISCVVCDEYLTASENPDRGRAFGLTQVKALGEATATMMARCGIEQMLVKATRKQAAK